MYQLFIFFPGSIYIASTDTLLSIQWRVEEGWWSETSEFKPLFYIEQE